MANGAAGPAAVSRLRGDLAADAAAHPFDASKKDRSFSTVPVRRTDTEPPADRSRLVLPEEWVKKYGNHLRDRVLLGAQHGSRDPLCDPRPAAQGEHAVKRRQQRLPFRPKSSSIIHDALLSGIVLVLSNRMMSRKGVLVNTKKC
jgi:hypothetical protein